MSTILRATLDLRTNAPVAPSVDLKTWKAPIVNVDLRTTYEERFTDLQETSRKQETEISTLQDKVVKLLKKISGFQKSISFTNEKAKILGDKVVHLTAQRDQLAEDLGQKDEQLSTVKTDLKKLKRQYRELEFMKDPLSAVDPKLDKAPEPELVETVAHLTAEKEELTTRLAEQNKEIQVLGASKIEMRAMLKRVTEELGETSGRLSTVQVENTLLKDRNQKLQVANDNYDAAFGELNDQNQRLREANDEFDESNAALVRTNEHLGLEVRSLRGRRTMEEQARLDQKENIPPDTSYTRVLR